MDGWTKHHSERPPKNSAAKILTNPVHWSHISSVYVLLDGDGRRRWSRRGSEFHQMCCSMFLEVSQERLCSALWTWRESCQAAHKQGRKSDAGTTQQKRKMERNSKILSKQKSIWTWMGGWSVSLMKTSVWGVAQGCYLQQKGKLKKCGTFFLPDERPSKNHTNDQCIENHFQPDNQTKRASGEYSAEKDRGFLTGPQHPFKKKMKREGTARLHIMRNLQKIQTSFLPVICKFIGRKWAQDGSRASKESVICLRWHRALTHNFNWQAWPLVDEDSGAL